MNAPPVCYPVFVFERRRDLETRERILAGTLQLNIFGRRCLSHRQRMELGEIIDGLTEDARAVIMLAAPYPVGVFPKSEWDNELWIWREGDAAIADLEPLPC